VTTDHTADGDGSTALLVDRPRPRTQRPLLRGSDLAMALWLVTGIGLAFLGTDRRRQVCRMVAVLALFGRRARNAKLNLMNVGGFGADRAHGIVRDVYAGRLGANLDVVRALLRGADDAVGLAGQEHLAQALAQGHGAIVWISDFAGAGDLSKVALHRAGQELAHLSREEHGFSTSRFGIRVLNPIRIKYEMRYLKERVVFDGAHPERALLRLRAWLKANGVVSITASAHEGRTLVQGPFLGGHLRLAVGALRLGHQTGAPVIPLFMRARANGPDAREIVLDAPLMLPPDEPWQEAVKIAAIDYLRRLEDFVRNDPALWVGWRRVGYVA